MAPRTKRTAPPLQSSHLTTSGPREVKETTESIVIAFILAFVFRAFIVEAFVIPTGSMASTLYGQHGTLICEDCGWENVYGLSDSSSRRNLHGPGAEVRCQNCGHLNTNLSINDGVTSRRSGYRMVPGNAESGDRILVFKWPLDIGGDLFKPKRWDVTVFKNPANGDENFIKRLVGLPNEVLEIIDGDVYTVPTSELSEATLKVLDQRRRVKYRYRTHSPGSLDEARLLAQPLPADVLNELAQKLRLQPKTEKAQESHWTVVYHHDYPPRKWDPGQPRWEALPADGPMWSTTDRRLSFAGASGTSATVQYAGKPIVDQNVYNIDVRPQAWNPVSDLRLQAVLCPKGGQGYLEMVLFKHDDAFAGRLHTDGRVTLTRWKVGRSAPELLADAMVHPLEPDHPIEMAFQNVDYRVTLEIGGRAVLETTPHQYAPDITWLRHMRPEPTRGPRITAANIDLELWHVVLYRDEYYTAPSLADSSAFGARRAGWGTAGNPILLRHDEYFMLGDNSPASKDSRLWDVVGPHLLDRGDHYQLGTVPKDQLVGRAFFVYWPSGLRPDWLPGRGEYFFEHFIPNVGRMRWIR